MAEIKKEIPVGPIDGSNKSFTLANVPSQIDDVFMDGAIYTTFSLVGQVITLVDAPSVSLFVDYSTGTSNPTGVSTVTFGKIKSEVWALMGQSPKSTTFSSDRVGDAINSLVSQIWQGRVTSMLDPNRTYRAGRMPFAESSAWYRHVAPSKLSFPFAVGDSTLSMATSGFPDSGAVLVGGEVFTYTGKTDAELVGVSGGTVPHLAAESVSLLHPFPANGEKPKDVNQVFPSGQTLEIPYDGTSPHVSGYSIVQSGTDKYLLFSNLKDSSLVSAKFMRTLYDMVDDADECPIPGKFGITVVAKIVAGSFLYEHALPNGQQALMNGYVALQNMFQFFTNDTVVVKQSVKPQSYAFRSVASTYPINRA